MEKKTIGGFIAALRRANGMTQRELAERLGVSDKTVSRWETDEGAPDLSLIPVIAEIFGVTCDELLRGQRSAAGEGGTAAPEVTAKGERERRRLLRSAMSRFRTRSLIAAGVSALGLIAALICNFAFLRATLGFYLGAAFYVAGAVLQAVFLDRAFLSVDWEESDASAFKRDALRLAELSFAVTSGFLGFTLPMAFVDAYLGVTAGSLLLYGAIGAAAALLVCGAACRLVNTRLIKKGVLILTEREAGLRRKNIRLQNICAAVLAGLLTLTALANSALTESDFLLRGTVFEDYESFLEFVEADVPDPMYNAAPEPDYYLDGDGSPISEDEALKRTITDSDGNVLLTFVQRNSDIERINYTVSAGSALPITVYTHDDFRQFFARQSTLNSVFMAAYFAEAAAVLLVYLLKREK